MTVLSLVNVGTVAGDHTGDTGQVPFQKVNAAITLVNTHDVEITAIYSQGYPLTAQQTRTQLLAQSVAGTLVGYPLVLTSDGGIMQWNGTQMVAAVDYTAAAQSVPVILSSAGSVGANGAWTPPTALPYAYPNCFVHFESGNLYSGNVEGLFYCQMQSTTAGTVYDNVMIPALAQLIPTSPTPIVNASIGAYTHVTGLTVQCGGANLSAYQLGLSGQMLVQYTYQTSPSLFTKRINCSYGGSTISTADTQTNSVNSSTDIHEISNAGTLQNQTVLNSAIGDYGGTPVGITHLNIDTTTAQSLFFIAQFDQATAYNSGTTYAVNALVSVGTAPHAVNYQSLVSSNTGNPPATSPTQWQQQNDFIIYEKASCQISPRGLIDYAATPGLPVVSATIIPPGAASIGCNTNTWFIRPQVSDISFSTSQVLNLTAGLAYQFSGGNSPWSNTTGNAPPYAIMSTYRGATNVLTLRQKGAASNFTPTIMTSTGNKVAGLLRYASCAVNWYAEWVGATSTNNQDHWDAYWMLPSFHDQNGTTPYWELDVHEGGYANQGAPFHGMHTSLLDWPNGSSGSAVVHNNLSTSGVNYGPSLDFTYFHKFGFAWNNTTGVGQPWIDDQPMPFSYNLRATDPTAINNAQYYFIVGPQQHGKQIPYDLYLYSMALWGG